MTTCVSTLMSLAARARPQKMLPWSRVKRKTQVSVSVTNKRNAKMKCKQTASEQMSLSGHIVGCEMRSFAANHSSVLDASNHVDYVEAFVLQLGEKVQHEAILSLLSSFDRSFSNGKIAYRPPGGGGRQLTSILDVGRWVNRQIYGGLAHAEVCTARATCSRWCEQKV
jgi:hypothetical protein